MAIPEDDRIVYPPVLTTLGRDHAQNWREATHTELKRVQGSLASRSTFGDIPAAQSFAAVYTAAQVTYEATLRGIQDDLVAAGEALARAGEQMRARDENAGDSFRGLMSRWSTEDGFSSTRRHDEAMTDEQVREGAAEKVRLESGSGTPESGTDPTVDPTAGPVVADTGMDVDG